MGHNFWVIRYKFTVAQQYHQEKDLGNLNKQGVFIVFDKIGRRLTKLPLCLILPIAEIFPSQLIYTKL